jgi:hypothetical protein
VRGREIKVYRWVNIERGGEALDKEVDEESVIWERDIQREREGGIDRLNGSENEREERMGERKGCIEGRREKE